jgi:hypothetical protein
LATIGALFNRSEKHIQIKKKKNFISRVMI